MDRNSKLCVNKKIFTLSLIILSLLLIFFLFSYLKNSKLLYSSKAFYDKNYGLNTLTTKYQTGVPKNYTGDENSPTPTEAFGFDNPGAGGENAGVENEPLSFYPYGVDSAKFKPEVCSPVFCGEIADCSTKVTCPAVFVKLFVRIPADYDTAHNPNDTDFDFKKYGYFTDINCEDGPLYTFAPGGIGPHPHGQFKDIEFDRKTLRYMCMQSGGVGAEPFSAGDSRKR